MTATKTIPTTKAELLAYTESQWRALARAADALTDEQWESLTDAAGWSVKDHVAHIVTWVRAEIALLQHGTPLEQSQGIPAAVWATGDFDQINEVVRQQTLAESPATLRAERDRVFAKMIETVSAYSDEDFARPATEFGLPNPGKSLLATLIEFHGDHFGEHRGYVEALATQG